MLNRDSMGHADVQLRDGSVDITSLFPRRMTLTAIVEKVPSDGNSKMTDAEQQHDKLRTYQRDNSGLVGHKFMSVTFCHQLISGVHWCVAKLS